MIPIWPSSLSYLIERGSFKMVQNESQLRSEFDYGPARMRRRFTRNIASQEFVLVMDNDEYEVFKSFWVYKLSSGVSWFTMPVWEGTEYVVRTIRFTEVPQVSDYAFRKVKLSAKVEVKDLSVWDEGTAEIVGEYGAEALFGIADVLNYTVNTHWGTTWP